MTMIGQRFNFEDVFFRDLTVCVLDTLEGQIKWINRFSSGDVYVNVPFYYSLTGDERFLLDSFADDIVSENRFIELNTDLIPRGHLTMTGFNIKSDEFANPNVWLRMVVENEIEIRKVLAKVRAVPITVNYDLEILLSSEIDTFKCSQAVMDTLWLYKFMYFEYNFMNIDAVILMPDSSSIEMSREKNMSSDNNIKMKVSFTVETYYPAFRRDRVNAVGYPQSSGSGMSDANGYALSGGISSVFSQPGDPGYGVNNSFGETPGNFPGGPGTGAGVNPSGTPRPPAILPGFGGGSVGTPGVNPGSPIPGQDYGVPGSYYGVTGSFFNNQDSSSPSDPYGTFTTSEFFAVTPKRTRWFNNILRSRERASGGTRNPNAGDPNPNNDGQV